MRLATNVINAGKWLKLGSLLLKAGVISPVQFKEALAVSKKGEALVGSVLVRAGFIRQEELESALHLQSLIAEGILYPDLAVRAMRAVHEQGATTQAALHSVGWQAAVQTQVDEIEYLLTESGFITKQVYFSIVNSTKCAFSLVLKGTLRCQQFNEVLKAVSLVRNNICSLQQATDALKTYRTNGTGIETTLSRDYGIALHATSLRLGELLIDACIVNEAEVLVALEKSLRTHSRLGDCLANGNALPAAALDVCLEIQQLASSGIMAADDAAKIAKRCIDLRESLEAHLARTKKFLEPPAIAARLVGILLEAQVITQDDLVHAHELTRRYCLGPTAALAVTGKIDRHVYKVLWHLEQKMSKDELTQEQAIWALQWCQRNGAGVDEAMQVMSGNYRRTAEPKEEQVESECSAVRLAALDEESLRLHIILAEEKKKNDQAFFLMACGVGLSVFITLGLIFSEYAALVAVAAIACAVAIFCAYKHAKVNQAAEASDDVQLATITAVRFSP